VTRPFRRFALPLTSYYVVTLVLPLANGAAQSSAGFAGHALAVLIVPPGAILLACTVQMLSRVLFNWCGRVSRNT
jgi:hypothetical protein